MPEESLPHFVCVPEERSRPSEELTKVPPSSTQDCCSLFHEFHQNMQKYIDSRRKVSLVFENKVSEENRGNREEARVALVDDLVDPVNSQGVDFSLERIVSQVASEVQS